MFHSYIMIALSISMVIIGQDHPMPTPGEGMASLA